MTNDQEEQSRALERLIKDAPRAVWGRSERIAKHFFQAGRAYESTRPTPAQG